MTIQVPRGIFLPANGTILPPGLYTRVAGMVAKEDIALLWRVAFLVVFAGIVK